MPISYPITSSCRYDATKEKLLSVALTLFFTVNFSYLPTPVCILRYPPSHVFTIKQSILSHGDTLLHKRIQNLCRNWCYPSPHTPKRRIQPIYRLDVTSNKRGTSLRLAFNSESLPLKRFIRVVNFTRAVKTADTHFASNLSSHLNRHFPNEL